MVTLPPEFEARFVAGRILWFFPALTALLAFGLVLNIRLLPLLIGQYVLLMLVFFWLGKRKVRTERQMIETFATEDLAFARSRIVGNPVSELLPLTGAVLIIGLFRSISRRDARWLIVVAAFGFLMAVGLLLRWLVYERWVQSHLQSLELRTSSENS